MYEIINEYTDTIGIHHLIVSVGDNTNDVIEYISINQCPVCGRRFTDNMICTCGTNNALIRL